MKKRFSLFLMLVVVTGLVISFASCATVVSSGVKWENEGRFGQHYIVAAKDWESRGLVFTEVEFEVTGRAEINGEVFTYQALLMEAQRLGADGIINVTIDKRIDSRTFGRESNMRQRWYGSALAIRFTNTLTSTTETQTQRETDRGVERENRSVVSPILHSTASGIITAGAVSAETETPTRTGLFGRNR